MSEFHIGDRIRIKTVDEMIESGSYSVRDDGHLHPTKRLGIGIIFNKRMQYMCGQTGVVTEVSARGYRYCVDFDDPETSQKGWTLTGDMMCQDCDVRIDDDVVFAFLDSY